MNQNDRKFFSHLNKDFFKKSEQQNGYTPAVALNDLNQAMNKDMPHVVDFMACYVLKDGTNYWTSSDLNFAEKLGMLDLMKRRLTYNGPTDNA